MLVDDSTSPEAEGGRGSVEVVDDGAEKIAVDTRSTSRGYLVVADSIARPGWTATVDGEPTPLVHADHALAAVSVPAGEHRVELSYRAPGLRAGVVISAASLVLAAGLVAAPALLRRRGRGSRSPGPARPRARASTR